MRPIANLVVHCTASSQGTSIASLRSHWKGLGWKRPGYHYVISPDGKINQLSPESEITNGVAGHNASSIHIAYIGGIDMHGNPLDNRTPQQKATLRDMLTQLRKRYPTARILGHRDFSPDLNRNGIVDPWERIKACPCFDAITEYAGI